MQQWPLFFLTRSATSFPNSSTPVAPSRKPALSPLALVPLHLFTGPCAPLSRSPWEQDAVPWESNRSVTDAGPLDSPPPHPMALPACLLLRHPQARHPANSLPLSTQGPSTSQGRPCASDCSERAPCTRLPQTRARRPPR